jgi:hypothetical protein
MLVNNIQEIMLVNNVVIVIASGAIAKIDTLNHGQHTRHKPQEKNKIRIGKKGLDLVHDKRD